MTPIDFYELLRQAVWDARWHALVYYWNAAVANPWILFVIIGAIALKGRRAVIRAIQWVGATWWHHSRG